ncbi:GNAT family N-acetyltransferase [Aliiroseovarius sp. YM-037]|uniref:GNAT family N-acetyltransferase n=1 Tax=Aliiroseovarius sp. YM-037 TaxID=3341728 RepID=UPI003A7FFD8E
MEARPVERKDLRALFQLNVAKDRRHLIAGTEYTIAEAAYDRGAYVWGLWDGETAVGLLGMVHPGQAEEADDCCLNDAAHVWRLLIDTRHQGKGYGRAALAFAEQQARDWGFTRINLTSVDGPGSAVKYYENQGYRRTGRIAYDEVELIRDL